MAQKSTTALQTNTIFQLFPATNHVRHTTPRQTQQPPTYSLQPTAKGVRTNHFTSTRTTSNPSPATNPEDQRKHNLSHQTIKTTNSNISLPQKKINDQTIHTRAGPASARSRVCQSSGGLSPLALAASPAFKFKFNLKFLLLRSLRPRHPAGPAGGPLRQYDKVP